MEGNNERLVGHGPRPEDASLEARSALANVSLALVQLHSVQLIRAQIRRRDSNVLFVLQEIARQDDHCDVG
jgi:hypothetical protein